MFCYYFFTGTWVFPPPQQASECLLAQPAMKLSARTARMIWIVDFMDVFVFSVPGKWLRIGRCGESSSGGTRVLWLGAAPCAMLRA
jgi:hypothetical protein